MGYFHNIRRISLLGLSTLEERLLEFIKNNDSPFFLDRYRLIPINITMALPEDNDDGIYCLNILIECDFIDEEKYRVGGSKYKKVEKHFRSYQ